MGYYQFRNGTVESKNPISKSVPEPEEQIPNLTPLPNRRNLSYWNYGDSEQTILNLNE